MSGIYIPGMEMPKTGRYFVSVDNTGGKDKTVIAVFSEFERKNKTRPLLAVHEIIPVPDHGRLIDGDKVFKRLQKQAMSVWGDGNPRYQIVLEVMDAIRFAPTIIPASGGDAE